MLDKTITGQGVAVMPGAVVDVTGGYQIASSGKVTGGDAGSLTLQGYSLIVAGDLKAQSLMGNNGGSITMHAGNVTISPGTPSTPGFNAGDPWPDNLKGQLVLGATQLDGTGFTNITVKSVNDLIIESGAAIGPSLTKLAVPVLVNGTAGEPGHPGTVQVTADDIGKSSFSLSAGSVPSGLTTGLINQTGPMNPQTFSTNRVELYPGASVRTSPGSSSSITVSAPVVDIGGSLELARRQHQPEGIGGEHHRG